MEEYPSRDFGKLLEKYEKHIRDQDINARFPVSDETRRKSKERDESRGRRSSGCKSGSHSRSGSSKRDDEKGADVPLVERRLKHKIRLDADENFTEDQGTKNSAEDEKGKKKHQRHREKKKGDSRERSRERIVKVKEKEAKVKLEHLDDEEELAEKEEKPPVHETRVGTEDTGNLEATAEMKTDCAKDDKDDFRLPQRKLEEDNVSSVFERSISLKMPSIKPLEKYKELKRKGLSGLKVENNANKHQSGNKAAEASSDQSVVEKSGGGRQRSGSREKDRRSSSKEKDSSSGRKKGLPDMR